MESQNEMDKEQRIRRAGELFKQGYNCSQSVVGAFADRYGLPLETALRVAASFGGGIGRMRETCGAACGMFLLLGLENGSVDPASRSVKERNYRAVRLLAGEFVRRNGALKCGELLGLTPKQVATESPSPEQRTEAYYQKRPCVKMVEEACSIYVDYLNGVLADDAPPQKVFSATPVLSKTY